MLIYPHMELDIRHYASKRCLIQSWIHIPLAINEFSCSCWALIECLYLLNLPQTRAARELPRSKFSEQWVTINFKSRDVCTRASASAQGHGVWKGGDFGFPINHRHYCNYHWTIVVLILIIIVPTLCLSWWSSLSWLSLLVHGSKLAPNSSLCSPPTPRPFLLTSQPNLCHISQNLNLNNK